jgi:hypothetical protein
MYFTFYMYVRACLYACVFYREKKRHAADFIHLSAAERAAALIFGFFISGKLRFSFALLTYG